MRTPKAPDGARTLNDDVCVPEEDIVHSQIPRTRALDSVLAPRIGPSCVSPWACALHPRRYNVYYDILVHGTKRRRQRCTPVAHEPKHTLVTYEPKKCAPKACEPKQCSKKACEPGDTPKACKLKYLGANKSSGMSMVGICIGVWSDLPGARRCRPATVFSAGIERERSCSSSNFEFRVRLHVGEGLG